MNVNGGNGSWTQMEEKWLLGGTWRDWRCRNLIAVSFSYFFGEGCWYYGFVGGFCGLKWLFNAFYFSEGEEILSKSVGNDIFY